ncbi:MAG: monoterpene epsilon-lactone hydrolase [Oleispira sp.]|jgi:monoterpene epsilon-lactone hydrolase
MIEFLKLKVFKGLNRVLLKPVFGPPFSYPIQRNWFEFMSTVCLVPKQTRITTVKMGSVEAEKIMPKDDNSSTTAKSKHVILYLHGGAYCICSARTHRSLTANLAKHCHMDVYVPHYRLAPEHAFPAGIDDCIEAYQWLLKQGYSGHQITLAGDSAGSGLVMATTLKIMQQELPKPNALVLISPWVDKTLPRKQNINDSIDSLLRWSNLEAGVAHYLQGHDTKDPLVSAVFADLTEFPPMLIQVGSEEILLGDARALNEKAKSDNVEVILTEYQDAWHVFQLQAGMLNVADQAVSEIKQFVLSHSHVV